MSIKFRGVSFLVEMLSKIEKGETATAKSLAAHLGVAEPTLQSRPHFEKGGARGILKMLSDVAVLMTVFSRLKHQEFQQVV